MPPLRAHWLLWLAVFTAPPIACADDLQAGAAAVDITPPIGLPMWGYGARHDKPSEGVLDPLYANALVLSVGDSKLAIVGLDLGRAPTRQSIASIRRITQLRAGIEHVLIVGSHTHHGPVLEVDSLPSVENSYIRDLERKIADVIVQADEARRPARIGAASTNVDMNRNRQSKLPDKPVDRELAVIRVDDSAGVAIAVAANFAAHPTMIPAEKLLYSADYPGAMKALVEKKMGAGTVCLFLQGAAGDMSANPGEHRGHEAFGRALGHEVLTLAQKIKTEPPAKPSIQLREEDFQFPKMRIDLNDPFVRAAYNQAFFKSLVDFYIDEYRDGVRPHLTVALVNGEIGLVGASGEFFSSHAIRLKQRSRLPHTIFFGYCNDYHQYFPTIEAAAEGGYGADPGVSPVELGAGELIMNRALFHLYDMQGKFNKLPL